MMPSLLSWLLVFSVISDFAPTAANSSLSSVMSLFLQIIIIVMMIIIYHHLLLHHLLLLHHHLLHLLLNDQNIQGNRG